jgi:hypothetical protein
VLFPPEGQSTPGQLPPRYTLWREPSLRPGMSRRVKLETGATVMNGDAMIGGYQLFAPRKPSLGEMHGGRYNVLARLTLTYQDIYARRHAAIFDYVDLYGWQCIGVPTEVSQDLESVDREARRR